MYSLMVVLAVSPAIGSVDVDRQFTRQLIDLQALAGSLALSVRIHSQSFRSVAEIPGCAFGGKREDDSSANNRLVIFVFHPDQGEFRRVRSPMLVLCPSPSTTTMDSSP